MIDDLLHEANQIAEKDLEAAAIQTICRWLDRGYFSPDGVTTSIDAKLCALCSYAAYKTTGLDMCTICPIGQAGYIGCKGTPFNDWCDASSTENSIQAARREYHFLLKTLTPILGT